ncbi:hypothetical protein M758_9G065000 [Ceratodon purpureus]|nr:hypothetical protein M758_9G065000 [Ceratodon purpureus]
MHMMSYIKIFSIILFTWVPNLRSTNPHELHSKPSTHLNISQNHSELFANPDLHYTPGSPIAISSKNTTKTPLNPLQ